MGEHAFHPLGARRAIVRGKDMMDMEKLVDWVMSRVMLLSTRWRWRLAHMIKMLQSTSWLPHDSGEIACACGVDPARKI